jgi:hypothetical protein
VSKPETERARKGGSCPVLDDWDHLSLRRSPSLVCLFRPRQPAQTCLFVEATSTRISSVGAATIGQGDIRVIVNALGTVTPIATVTVQTQLSGRLLEVGFTEGGQEAQPVTWYSDRNSKFSFATEEQLAGEGSQELIAHIRPVQQARYLN